MVACGFFVIDPRNLRNIHNKLPREEMAIVFRYQCIAVYVYAYVCVMYTGLCIHMSEYTETYAYFKPKRKHYGGNEMKLHIIRHGDPGYPNDNLTDLGRIEAEALALRMEKLPLERIYASSLGRAQATAKFTADKKGMSVETLTWIREMSELKAIPDSNELPNPIVVWNLPGHQLRQIEKDEEYMKDIYPYPQMTSRFEELRRGWIEFLRLYNIEMTDIGWTTDASLPEQDLAIFCHHGSGLVLLSLIMDIPVSALWRSIWLAPTSVSTVLFEQYAESRVNPRLICIGDTSHLYPVNLNNNTSGLLYNTR